MRQCLGLSRHRRFSLTGETLVNPLLTVSTFSRVYVVARPRFIPRTPKKRERESVDEGTVPDTRTGTILFYRPFASYVCDSLLRQPFSLWAVKRNARLTASNITRRLTRIAFTCGSYSLRAVKRACVCRCTNEKLLEFEMSLKGNLF